MALAALFFFVTPTRIAHQDLGSLLAQQSGVAERARTFFLSNPFASLRTATFTPTRPLGSTIPAFRVHFDPDITGSISRQIDALDWTGFDVTGEEEVFQLPAVNRANKGDLLKLRPVALPPADTVQPPAPVESAALAEPDLRLDPNPAFDIAAPITAPIDPRPAIDATVPALARAVPNPEFDVAMPLAPDAAELADTLVPRADVAGTLSGPADAGMLPSWTIYRVSRLMFGIDEDILPPSAFEHRSAVKLAALPNAAAETGSQVQKGIVTGDERRPQSPAERLKLVGTAREKADKCLANAIYFESLGEQEKGQIAVAQVVVNRAFSGYYPESICGVVYQNAHRHLACQFTFACDGIPDVVTEPAMWEQAKRIARDMLDGKLWLAEVGKATHYHAYWVRPAWVREMRKIQRIGVHTFYRPRKWEDG